MIYADLEPDPGALTARDLHEIAGPTFKIVETRLERGEDTLFDHFLWDNVGDPVAARDEQGGVTDEGYMLHLRRLRGNDPLEWPLTGVHDDPRAYEISLGNIHDNNGEYDGSWRNAFVLRAERVESSARLPGHAMTTIHFTDNPLETVPSRVLESNPRALTIAAHLAERALQKEIENWWANKPRVVLSDHLRRLYMPQAPYERLYAWSDITEQLDRYGERIAQMLMAEKVSMEYVQAS